MHVNGESYGLRRCFEVEIENYMNAHFCFDNLKRAPTGTAVKSFSVFSHCCESEHDEELQMTAVMVTSIEHESKSS